MQRVTDESVSSKTSSSEMLSLMTINPPLGFRAGMHLCRKHTRSSERKRKERVGLLGSLTHTHTHH